MENAEIEAFVSAYRQGATADFIQPKINGRYGALWTIPPCDPAAAERAGRQMLRMGAEELRWIRRALLRGAGGTVEVMIVTELPGRLQEVRDVWTGRRVRAADFLGDQSTDALAGVIQT